MGSVNKCAQPIFFLITPHPMAGWGVGFYAGFH